MIVVIAIIGVLSAIAVPNVGKVLEGSRRGVAESVVQTLNKATREFGHSQWDLRQSAVPASGGDELLLLRTLQWRDTRVTSELNPRVLS